MFPMYRFAYWSFSYQYFCICYVNDDESHRSFLWLANKLFHESEIEGHRLLLLYNFLC